MPEKKIRFGCKICNKTITLALSDEFQENFKNTADKWPYPLVYAHAGHWAIVYVDADFRERGVVVTSIGIQGE